MIFRKYVYMQMCKYIDVFIFKYYMIIYTQFEFQLFSPVIFM